MLKATRTRHAELHNQNKVDKFRITMVQIANAKLESDRTVVHPNQIQALIDSSVFDVCIAYGCRDEFPFWRNVLINDMHAPEVMNAHKKGPTSTRSALARRPLKHSRGNPEWANSMRGTPQHSVPYRRVQTTWPRTGRTYPSLRRNCAGSLQHRTISLC